MKHGTEKKRSIRVDEWKISEKQETEFRDGRKSNTLLENTLALPIDFSDGNNLKRWRQNGEIRAKVCNLFFNVEMPNLNK